MLEIAEAGLDLEMIMNNELAVGQVQNLEVMGIIWSFFIFALGACVGSFLNVVIYRLPRDMSLVQPGSRCPACGKDIKFYHNIPIFSWLFLSGKCRYCGEKISIRYFWIELLTASLYLLLFLMYFGESFGLIGWHLRDGLPGWYDYGWVVFGLHLIIVSGFIAASAIDIELWVIPLSICWFVTFSGIIVSTLGVLGIDFYTIKQYGLLPWAHSGEAAVAAGGAIGLVISMVLLMFGIIKPSYQSDEDVAAVETTEPNPEDPDFNHRLESLKEIVFLAPILICTVGFYMLFDRNEGFHFWWIDFSQRPAIAGFFGSVLGYLGGCGIVWATRILGTLGFGKEAMGLGDVHLMGAAGAVIGLHPVVVAFFIAPFFGLGWAVYQMFFKKTRQIPYGPFLSAAVFLVMIWHNPIMDYIYGMFFYR